MHPTTHHIVKIVLTEIMNKEQKLGIYARLLNVDDPDNLDTKALTEAVGVSAQTLGAWSTS